MGYCRGGGVQATSPRLVIKQKRGQVTFRILRGGMIASWLRRLPTPRTPLKVHDG